MGTFGVDSASVILGSRSDQQKSTFTEGPVLTGRPAAYLLALAIVALVTVADVVAGACLVVGLVMLGLLVRHRSRRSWRVITGATVLILTLGITAAALAVPTFHSTRIPLEIPGLGLTPADPAATGSKFEVMGFVDSTANNAALAVTRSAGQLTTVSPTGANINPDGTLTYSDQSGVLARAHAAGARAELVLQNIDESNGQFQTAAARSGLSTAAARQRLATQLTTILTGQGWDGLVVDLELVPVDQRANEVDLLRRLRVGMARGQRLVLAEAVPDPTDPFATTAQLRNAARIVDLVVLMTYDQHDPSGDPGPIGAPSWMQASIRSVEHLVPRSHLALGVAAYGYEWTRGVGNPGSYSADQLRAKFGRSAHWDAATQEWHARDAHGNVAWWTDARSIKSRVALARRWGLAGAAIWDLSTAGPLTSATVGHAIMRTDPDPHGQRSVNVIPARGLVALTFDDGPDPTWTPQILSILEREHVPATFFDVGSNVMRGAALVRREVNGGNIVADHTYLHNNPNTETAWQIRADILAGAWAIQGATGRWPTMFRFPYGSNGTSDATQLRQNQIASSLNMHTIDWTVDSSDWSTPGVQAIVSNVLSQVHSSDAPIILMHDGGGDRSQTVAALPTIISSLRSQGYRFTTVDRLSGEVAQPYASRHGVAANVKAVGMIALWKIWVAWHTLAWRAALLIAVLASVILLLSWMLALSQRRRARHARAARPTFADMIAANVRPTVSVLVPAHNEEPVLAKTLASLAVVTGVDQVIVAVNNSTDRTAEIARESGVDVIELGAVGKAGALNASLPEAIGEVLVVVDADTVLSPDFVEQIAPHFLDPSVGAVAGNVRVGNQRRLLPRLQAIEYVTSLNVDRRAQARLGVVAVVPGAAGAFRRTAVVAAGGWSTRTLVEDADLTVALISNGWKVPYEDRAISYTEAPETPRDVLRQRRRWAFGSAQLASVHGRRVMARGSGRVGWLLLPWSLTSQVVMPALGPIIDVYALWLVMSGAWQRAAAMIVLCTAADLIVSQWALRADRQPLRLLLMVPLARLIWRPLVLFAVAGSLRSWLSGSEVGWAKVTRRNTVRVGTAPAADTSPGAVTVTASDSLTRTSAPVG